MSSLLVPVAVPVTAKPHPFAEKVELVELPAGLTLAEIVDVAIPTPWLRPYAAVALEGHLIPPSHLARVRPRPGRRVTITIIPMGGGGEGGGRKNPAAMVLSLVVMVAAIVAQQYWVAAPLAAGTITGGTAAAYAAGIAAAAIVATIGINALLPPPRPKLRELGGAARLSPAIAGARNELRPFGVVPRVLGRHRFFPPLGAVTFTEILGNDQYLRVLLDLGPGPLRLSSLKIGEDPLTNFTSVEYQVRMAEVVDDPSKTDLTDGPTSLYSNDVAEDVPGVNLAEGLPEGESNIGPWIVRRSRLDADELSVDVTYFRGVGKIDKGEREHRSASVRIRYAPADTQNWTDVGVISATDNLSVQPLRRGRRWTVAPGQYDVGLRQEGLVGRGENPQEALFAEAIWTALRTIRHVDPIVETGHTKLALLIKATDQLAGTVDTLNVIAEPIVPDWDDPTNTWITRATSNPASLARDVLQGPGAEEPAEDDEIDLPQLQHFHEWCVANGFTFNHIVDYETTDQEVLQEICAAGRAMPTLRDGSKFSVIIDEPQSVVRAHFSPRNAWGFTFEKSWIERPHAFRGLFMSEKAGWQVSERLIFADGFDENTATRYETLEMVGIVDDGHIWKLGRYRHAELELRPERYTFFTDWEHVVTVRGDRAKVAYDVILVGLGQTRIRQLVTSGGNTTGLVLDEPIPMETGKVYAVVVRRSDGSEQIHQLVTQVGEQFTVTLASPLPTASGPQVDDLTLFGQSGLETTDVLIRELRPGPDLTAQLTCVPYHAGIYTADQGAIPAFDPKITRPALTTAPPVPIIDGVRSDDFVLVRDADGTLAARIVVALHFHSGSALLVSTVEARWRESGTESDWRQLKAPVAGDAVAVSIQPVEEGRRYDVRLRSVAANGAVSGWVEILSHLVIGTSAKPPDVPAVFVEDNRLTWSYPLVPLDLAGFAVRRHFGNRRSWGDAQPLHANLLTGTQLPEVILPMGLVTYLVKAVDTSGNESALPGVAFVDLGSAPVENIVVTKDYKASGFPGTIVNGAVVLGQLEAAVVGVAPFWTGLDERPFWAGDNGVAFWGLGHFARMDYLFSLLPAAGDVPADLTLEPDVTAESWQLHYRLSGTELFWSGNSGGLFWSGDDTKLFWGAGGPADESAWIPWPGKLKKVPRQVFEFRLRTAPGPIQGVVHGLKAHLDVPDLIEFFDDVIIAAGTGTRLPIQAAYREIRHVEVTLQADGGTARTVEVVDKDSVQGPLIKTRDAAGVVVAGEVDASVRGR